FSPARNQRCSNAGSRSGIWILICRDVDAFRASAIDEFDSFCALPPDIGAQRLDMRDVDGQTGFATDANDLFNRSQQTNVVRTFVTHVRVIDAAAFGYDLGQFDDLFGFGEAAGRIVQTG